MGIHVAADYAPSSHGYTRPLRARYLALHASGQKERLATDEYSLWPLVGWWFVTSYRRGITALQLFIGAPRHAEAAITNLEARPSRAKSLAESRPPLSFE